MLLRCVHRAAALCLSVPHTLSQLVLELPFCSLHINPRSYNVALTKFTLVGQFLFCVSFKQSSLTALILSALNTVHREYIKI